MSRSGYSDDCENLVLWRNAVDRAIGGRRGQAFLREMLATLDALPDRRLVANSFAEPDSGHVCALGAVGKARGMNLADFEYDPDDDDLDRRRVADSFGIAFSLACEVMYENDEGNFHDETPEHRFARMRRWIERQLIEREQPA